MSEILDLLRHGAQPVGVRHLTIDDLVDHIHAGELVVCLTKIGAYLGVYQTRLDRTGTDKARVVFTGRCRLDRSEYACRVELACESRQGHVWLTMT